MRGGTGAGRTDAQEGSPPGLSVGRDNAERVDTSDGRETIRTMPLREGGARGRERPGKARV